MAQVGDTRALFGVIDIGSNSVRMVIFGGPDRAPTPVFSEKVLCGLGRDLAKTRRLNEAGVKLALLTLRRFAALCGRMKVTRITAVATAAVREAENGKAFVAEVEQVCHFSIRILSGIEEARYAGLGVLSGMPMFDGIIGDLGGGSLELIDSAQGQIRQASTLPLGPFHLSDLPEKELKSRVDDAFGAVPWLAQCTGKSLVLVGGAWRAVARIHMVQTNYPLRTVHHYCLKPNEAEQIAKLISLQSRKSLLQTVGLARRRVETLPLGAFVLRRLIKYCRPSEVVFSALGLREGLHFAELSAAVQGLDPLIEVCRDMSMRESRFPEHGEELAKFVKALFPSETPEQARLRLAASLLSDVAWRVNPDYRGEQAFRRVLRAPYVGIDHQGRAFMAAAVYARYEGDGADGVVTDAHRLIERSSLKRAVLLGLSLRLAHSLSGGAPGALQEFRLVLDQNILLLKVSPSGIPLLGEVIPRRLEAIAKYAGWKCRIDLPAGASSMRVVD